MLELLNPYLNSLPGRWCTIFCTNLLSRNQQNHPSFESCMIAQHVAVKMRRLQPLLFDILLRNRMRPLSIIGDIKKSISTNQIKRIAQVCTTTSLRSSLWWSLKKKHRRVSVHQSDIWVSRSFYPQHLLSKACRAIQRGVSWKNRSIIRRYLRTRHTIKWRLFQRVGQIQRGINKDYGCRWIWAE